MSDLSILAGIASAGGIRTDFALHMHEERIIAKADGTPLDSGSTCVDLMIGDATFLRLFVKGHDYAHRLADAINGARRRNVVPLRQEPNDAA